MKSLHEISHAKVESAFPGSTTKPSTNYSTARPMLGEFAACLFRMPVCVCINKDDYCRCLMTHRTTVRERAPDPTNPGERLKAPLCIVLI